MDIPNRRQLMKTIAGLGVGSVVFQRAVVAQAPKEGGALTEEMIKQAEWISGLKLTDADRKALVGRINSSLRAYERLRKVPLPNDVPPAFAFIPSAEPADRGPRGPVEPTSNAVPKKPDSSDDLAFLPLTALSQLVRTRAVSSVELTKLYLERMKKYDPALKCVVTLTEELALKQAESADREITAGRYRGPLHGIPWGAKDLISYPGYKTTWGAGHYKDQTLDAKATVARKLEEAGAVMVAKLTLGALAMGDQWFGGMTRNPWDVRQGSSGSSAGSASAVVAGLVGFAIGSETLGSIISPCTRCGASGLRPTFGRVARTGCMTLAWTMDKLGPIARSIEDCALVLGAIHGSDGLDAAAVDRPFRWPLTRDLRSLRVGYLDTKTDAKDRKDLQVLRELGVKLVPVKLPESIPVDTTTILYAECAAAFDDITRQGVNEGIGAWGASFRQGEFIPAVEYIRANRVRTLLMKEMEKLFETVDLYVGGFADLAITNLTGHPTAVLPNGFSKGKDSETPVPIMFTGRLFGETELLAVAHAYQQATGHHLKRPPMENVTVEKAGKG